MSLNDGTEASGIVDYRPTVRAIVLYNGDMKGEQMRVLQQGYKNIFIDISKTGIEITDASGNEINIDFDNVDLFARMIKSAHSDSKFDPSEFIDHGTD